MPKNDGGFLQKLFGTVASVFGGTVDAINRIVEDSYRKGYEDGASAMRDSILMAATAPLKIPPVPSVSPFLPSNPSIVEPHEKAARATRGSIGRFITDTLKTGDGLTQQEIKDLAVTIEGLSAASIGNELRRKEGTMYRRDTQNRWHLIDVRIQESAAGARKEPAAQEVYQPAA